MANFSARIAGIGMFVPEKILTNKDLEKIVDTSDQWIREKIGVEERRIASEDQAASDLAIPAALEAIKNAGIAAIDLDLIILTTVFPDVNLPATAAIIQGKIGAKNAATFDLHQGCPGFVTSLVVGSNFVSNGLYKNVLVIGVCIDSKWMNWNDRTKCVIFGDGAGAVVLQRCKYGEGFLSCDLGTDGLHSNLLSVPIGGSRFPPNEKNLSDPLIKYGKPLEGREVFSFSIDKVPISVLRAIKNAGVEKDDVNFFIFHQANKNIISNIMNKLEISMDKTFINIQKYGNTSEASVPIALYEAVKHGKIKKEDFVVLSGFGSGLSWATVVFKWS